MGDLPLSNIPIIWRYNRGTLPKSDRSQTNASGEVLIGLSQFEPGTRHSELKIELDLDHLAPLIEASPARAFFSHLPVPSLSIPIELIAPTIYFDTEEKILGKKRDQQLLRHSIAQGLSDQGVTWVQSRKDADLILELSADTRNAGSGSGFFTAKLNASVVLKTPDGQPVLQQNLEEIKGVQLDWEGAHQEAYRKATLEIKGRFMRELVNALYK
jgi:hypothetical protein